MFRLRAVASVEHLLGKVEADHGNGGSRDGSDHDRAVASWASSIARDLRDIITVIENQLEGNSGSAWEWLRGLSEAKDAADRALELTERLIAVTTGDRPPPRN